MSGSKLPLTLENLKADQEKIIEAIANNENYDPFGVAASFEPASAAAAINPVVQNAPAVSASSQADAGLEKQPGVELDKMDVEKMDLEKDDKEGTRKSSEPDWEMAEVIPVTENEMVGDLIQDQGPVRLLVPCRQ